MKNQKTLDILYKSMVLKRQKEKDKKNDNNAHNNRDIRGFLLSGGQAAAEEVWEIQPRITRNRPHQ